MANLLTRLFRGTVDKAIEERTPEIVERARPQIEAGLLLRLFDEDGPNTSGLDPNKAPRLPLYAYDFPWKYAIAHQSHRKIDSEINFDAMRGLADNYDVLRSCIIHLLDEMEAIPIRVVPRDEDDDSDETKDRAKAAQVWLDEPGGLGGEDCRREQFERMLFEDVLVLGATAVYYDYRTPGLLEQVVPIDAATIRPRVDAYGWDDPDSFAEQYVHGRYVRSFSRTELRYDGLFPVSHSPYFKSPVEFLLRAIIAALRADDWNRKWLTSGNEPSAMYTLPEDWEPTQVREFVEWFNQLLRGNDEQRAGINFLPHGSAMIPGSKSRKDQEFQEFELWLLRRTCAIYGVQPASIGYVGEQYKVTQEASMRATSQFGVKKLTRFRRAIYNDILARLGYTDLHVVDEIEDEEDEKTRAERYQIACGGPWRTRNEIRADEGLDPIEGGEELLSPGGGAVGAEPEEDDPEAAEGREKDLERWERKVFNRRKEGDFGPVPFQSKYLGQRETRALELLIRRHGSMEDKEVAALFDEIRTQ